MDPSASRQTRTQSTKKEKKIKNHEIKSLKVLTIKANEIYKKCVSRLDPLHIELRKRQKKCRTNNVDSKHKKYSTKTTS